jgi:ABC-2 type transport system permease protein
MVITSFSTSGMGLLLGCLSLVTRNVMFVNNVVFFLLFLFSGANLRIETLPAWMQAISQIIPLTRGIAAARLVISGSSLSDVAHLIGIETLIGLIYALLGFGMFQWFEIQAKRRGTLEVM